MNVALFVGFDICIVSKSGLIYTIYKNGKWVQATILVVILGLSRLPLAVDFVEYDQDETALM